MLKANEKPSPNETRNQTNNDGSFHEKSFRRRGWAANVLRLALGQLCTSDPKALSSKSSQGQDAEDWSAATTPAHGE
jgi:hypothetical protein